MTPAGTELPFEFAPPGRIIFGFGRARSAAEHIARMGSRVLLVCSPRSVHAAALAASLARAGMPCTQWHVVREPALDDIRGGVACARQHGCDVVFGVGGGSAIDAAKAIAAFVTNAGDVLEYLEGIGGGAALVQPPLPCIAAPTTAGTGAEVTFNAVLSSPEHRVKVSVRSPLLAPRLAIVDPELTLSMPPALTAATGMDALTQLIEAFVSRGANAMTDMACRAGMQRAAQSLRKAYRDGSDRAARADMAFAALCSGMALANAKLGAVHGLAGPLGGLLNAPHGALCGRLLPFVIEANIAALRAHHGDAAAATLTRYAEIGTLMCGRADPDALLAHLRALCAELHIAPLSHYGATPAHITAAVPRALAASSMKGNPVPLPADTLEGILRRAL